MRYIGHDEPWRQWRAAMAGERMHHAWLLAGRRGVGKGPFALAAARELVGAEPDRDHPDIIVLSPPPPPWYARLESRKRSHTTHAPR